MTRRPMLLLAGLTTALTAVAACSSDDSEPSGRARLVDMTIDFADENGLTADESCLTDVFDSLSDDDVELLVDAGIDGDVELSAEGEARSEALADCLAVAES